MNATELRIGNYVEKSLKSGNGRKRFDKIRICDIQHIYENDGSFNYNPIPLTEEILLKCGFKYISCQICGQDQWAGMAIWSLITPSGNYITLRGNINDIKVIYPHGTAILYLHQLQNLYFALTDQELEINL